MALSKGERSFQPFGFEPEEDRVQLERRDRNRPFVSEPEKKRGGKATVER